jgi:hypothetical protein
MADGPILGSWNRQFLLQAHCGGAANPADLLGAQLD